MSSDPRRQPEIDRLAPGMPITLHDVLRAVFMPEEAESPPSQAGPSPYPEAPAPALSEALAPPDLDGPTSLTYPGELPVPPEGADVTRLIALALGTVAALATGYVGQVLLRTEGAPGGLLITALASIAWLSLIAFEIALPDGALLRRGPRVHGPAGAAALPALDSASLIPRLALGLVALSLSAATYALTGGNHFTTPGLITWVLSVLTWMLAAAERSPGALLDDAAAAWQRLKDGQGRPSVSWPALAALALILALAGFFRLYRLDAIPIEMTSDHVEKLLDGWRVSQGVANVFFRGNGGREAIQFYLVPIAARLFGTGFSFLTLKLVSVIEALLLIPLIVRWGREMVDRETGLLAAALLAVSWWHVMLARLALRIVLTPLVFTAILIALVRGIRMGWRRSWVWAGFWMGVGVYSYQALRITPLVAAVAFLTAVAGPLIAALRAANGPEAAHTRQIAARTLARQGANLIAAGVVALAIFVPMLRVWHDYPDDLWNRVINRTTASEVAINEPVGSIFLHNYGRALGMFHVNGDAAWINAPPGTPALDEVTGVLLILGLLAWLVRLYLRHDPADAFVLLAGLIMLLPTALAVAFPIENPSLTRASGMIPVVFMLAAWPLALIRQRWEMLMGMLPGRLLGGALIVILISAAGALNYRVYFEDYAASYRGAALNPSEVAGAVREIIGPEAPLDGVWLVGWPYWHDYRAIGIEAGEITFSNAILDSAALAARLEEDPGFGTRPLVFIVHPEDSTSLGLLDEAFPSGEARYFRSETAGRDFLLYVVPG